MKCDFCSGNLRIEDAVCPHCGKSNPFYKAHREDMREYEKRFSKARDEAIETNVRHTRSAVRIAIVAVLVALILGAFIVLLFMDDITDSMKERANRKNADEILATLHQYEEAKDFYNFRIYFDSHQAGMYSYGIREFDAVDRATAYDGMIVNSIAGLITGENYSKASDLASSVTRNLGYLYEIREQAAKNPSAEMYSAKHMEAVEYMIDDVNTMLKVYCGFSDAEIAELETATVAERQLVLEKKFERILADED